MARRAMIEILGDAKSFIQELKKSSAAADYFQADLKKLAITAKSSADAQVAASVHKQARLRQEIRAYKEISSAARRGSREQVAAAQLAAQAEQRLARSVGTTAREQRALAASAAHAERNLGRATRGALAGSGIFRSLGRSIAFASGGFLAFATAGQFLRASIDAAKDARVTQKQLAAQFRASGQALGPYQKQIDETTSRLAALAGFENDELKAAFVTIFRTTGDVSRGLRDLATATDLARAKRLSLAQASLIIAKTEAGNTTLLRRQGFQIAKNATAEQALAQLRKAVAGQARAGTTEQQRFGAVLHETEEIVGKGILPVLNKYLRSGTQWLAQMNQSGKLQKDVNGVMHQAGQVIGAVADAARIVANVFHGLNDVTGSTKRSIQLLGGAFLLLKARAALIKWGFIEAGIANIGARATVSSGEVGLLGARLGALSAIGPITVPIILLTQTKQGRQIANEQATSGKAFVNDLLHGDITKGADWKKFGSDLGKLIFGGVKADSPVGRLLHLGGDGQSGPDFNGPPKFPLKPFVPHKVTSPPKKVTVHTATGTKRLSLAGRFNLAELALAKAGTTTGTSADDLKALRLEKAITLEQIRQDKTLKAKTADYQKLGGIIDQINSITEAGAKKAAREVKKHADQWVKLGGAIQAISHDMRSATAAMAHKGPANYHAVSTASLTRGLGLSHDARELLRERLAQAQAHGGYAPNGPAAQGQIIHINTLHVHGVKDVRTLHSQLERVSRSAAPRRGTR